MAVSIAYITESSNEDEPIFYKRSESYNFLISESLISESFKAVF